MPAIAEALGAAAITPNPAPSRASAKRFTGPACGPVSPTPAPAVASGPVPYCEVAGPTTVPHADVTAPGCGGTTGSEPGFVPPNSSLNQFSKPTKRCGKI